MMVEQKCGDEATHFHDKENHNVGSNYSSLAVILIDFVFKKTIMCKCS